MSLCLVVKIQSLTPMLIFFDEDNDSSSKIENMGFFFFGLLKQGGSS